MRLFLFFFSFSIYAHELVLIQAVSQSHKTFITRTGKEDGLALGQEATFTNKHVTLSAKAKEVTREFTLWEVSDPRSTIPFEREDAVTMNRNLESVWYQMPMMKVKPIELNYHWAFKLGYTQALSESIDRVSSTKGQVRRGGQMSFLHNWPINQQFYIGLGARYDSESANNDIIRVPTERVFALASIEYHLRQLEFYESTLYAGATLGAGYSQTKVAGRVQKGLAFLLPSLKVGLQIPIQNSWAGIIEGSCENVSMQEKTSDGRTQSSTIVNAKMSFGLRYTY